MMTPKSVLALAALCLVAAVQLLPEEIKQEVEATPEPADFKPHFQPLGELSRRLQVAAPCTGIHGCGAAFKTMITAVDSIHLWDLEPGYRTYLMRHLLDMGMSATRIAFNLGKVCGNLLQMPLSCLRPPLDILVAGPPCPPWAGQGMKKSTQDPRAEVFLRLLAWTVYAIKACGLLAVILENVLGITYVSNGRAPVIYAWLQILRQTCPEFEWSVEVLRLVDYLSPQTRIRMFLKGLRKCVAPLPAALGPFGRAGIRSVLGRFPPTRSMLCRNQQKNLRYYEAQIKQQHSRGHLEDSDVVVISVDRAPQMEYKTSIVRNQIPTLTTNSGCLMVLSVGDVVRDVPDNEREFLRHLRSSEKLCAQGFSPSVHLDLDSRCAQKAAGNAYPPALLIAELHPIVDALTRFDLAAWPPPSELASHEAALRMAEEAVALFRLPTRKVAKKSGKSDASQERRRRLKRKRRRGELA